MKISFSDLLALYLKQGKSKTRLIFHLSYDFPDDNDGQRCKSLNHHTPKDLCPVKYPDVDYAVRVYLHLKRQEEER